MMCCDYRYHVADTRDAQAAEEHCVGDTGPAGCGSVQSDRGEVVGFHSPHRLLRIHIRLYMERHIYHNGVLHCAKQQSRPLTENYFLILRRVYKSV